MKNNYLLESMDGVVLTKKIEEIIIKTNFSHATRSIYDLEEKSLNAALEDLDTYNFLNDKKIVIIHNVFTSIQEKKMEYLLKYLDHFHSNNLLILTSKKIDSRLNIVKKIKKNPNIEVVKLQINPFEYIQNNLKDYKISNKDIYLLMDKCKDDITKIDSECNKLKIYKFDALEITREDIENLVVKKLGDSNDSLFSFIKYLLIKDKRNALRKYRELVEYQIDSSSIIGLIASQLKLIYQIKILMNQNFTNDQITKKLSLKSSYQVRKMSEYSYYYTNQELGQFIHLVADLDYQIKSGRIDSKIALDLFIIHL